MRLIVNGAGHTPAGSVTSVAAPAATARRRGAAAVEFALVAAFVLFPVFLGLVEVGRAVMATHILSNAARAGCRVGVIQGKSTQNIKDAVTDALKGQGVSGTTVTVTVNDATAEASSAASGAEITVKVTVPVANVTWIPVPKFISGNLSGQYTLDRE